MLVQRGLVGNNEGEGIKTPWHSLKGCSWKKLVSQHQKGKLPETKTVKSCVEIAEAKKDLCGRGEEVLCERKEGRGASLPGTCPKR